EYVVRLEAGAEVFEVRDGTFVEFLFELDFLSIVRRQLGDRVARAPHRSVLPHLAVVAIVLTHHGTEPPDRLEAHVGIRFAAELARDLRDILEAAFAEHLEDLAVPLVIFLRRDAVVRRIDLRDFVPVGEIRHDDDDRLLPVTVDRRAPREAESTSLFTLRVDVAGDDARRDRVVRIEQFQRDDRAGVDWKPAIVHRRSLHAVLLAKPRIQLAELRIDAELVRDLAELVPVRIDERPRRFGIDLK